MISDVSIVVPTFDRASLIGKTIDSLLAQTCAPAEVIVVDDGSTDETETVIRRYGSSLRYHRVEAGELRNIGPSAARNLGASLATSAWLAFCDSDDLWMPTKLERQMRLHQLYPELEFSFTDYAYVVSDRWESPSRFTEAPEGYWEKGRRIAADAAWVYDSSLYERVLAFHPIAPSTLLISQRRFRSIGGYLDRFSRGLYEDFEFSLRNAGEPAIGVLADPLVGIRKHPGNRSGDMLRNWLDQVKILEYVLATHAAARQCADLLREEIRKRRCYAAGCAFAAGRLEIVRELAPLIEWQHRDWRTATKIAVASLPEPLAGSLRDALVAGNRWLGLTRS